MLKPAFSFFRNALLCTLAIAFFVGPSSRSSFAGDGNAAATASVVQSGIMIAMGGKELQKDLAATPVSSFAVALDVATILGGTLLLATSLSAKNRTEGIDIPPPDPNADPSNQKNRKPSICADDNPLCNCSGPDSQSNPVCNPALLESAVDLLKDKIKEGEFTPPDGETPEEYKEKLDNALSDIKTLNSVVSGELPESALDSLSGIRGSTFNSAGRSGLSRAGKDAFTDNTGLFGSNFGSFGSNSSSKTVGPEDRTGLGKTLFDGLLNIINAENGQDLTVFQRNTRRHQGDNGSRAFMMARIEQIRQSALKFKEKNQIKPLAKTAKNTKVRKPATPQPKGKKAAPLPQKTLASPK